MSCNPVAPAPARRVVVTSAHFPPELVPALTEAGLEVRQGGDPSAPDVLLTDPLCAEVTCAAIETIVAARIGALLSRASEGLPALHESVMSQAERGVLSAVLTFTGNHLGHAAAILGLDRNTCARKARAFGLLDEPSRGRKPRATKAKPTPAATRRRPPERSK